MFKKQKKTMRESGQIIYLVAIGIVLLFGFLGLAVDGSRLYSENRRAQHAADNAAMTGALFIGQNYELLKEQGNPEACDDGVFCKSNKSGRIAMENAGFNISDWFVNYNVESQPSPYSGIQYVDVEVRLEVEIEAYFAKVFTDQPLRTAVVAVARVYPSQNFAFGYSMLSTSEDICNGIEIEGSIDIELDSGGMHSNSSGCDDAIDIKGGENTVVTIVGPFTGSSPFDPTGKPTINLTSPYEQLPPMQMDVIPTPECDDPDPSLTHDSPEVGNITYHPGNQSNMQFDTPSEVFFEPGIYCINGDFRIMNGTFYGEGVLFYVKDGDVEIFGNPEIHFSAPTGDVSDINGKTIYDGLLIYMDPDNEGDIQIAGSGSSELSGTVYAPGPGNFPKCKLTGDKNVVGDEASVDYGIQLICSTIKVAGNSVLNLTFDDSKLYSPPPELSLLH